MRQPHRQGELAHRRARFGQPAGGVDRVESGKQRPRLGQCGRRRRVEEGQRARIGDAEGGAVEHQRRKVGLQDLGRVVGRKCRGLLGAPQADRHARLRCGRRGRRAGRRTPC